MVWVGVRSVGREKKILKSELTSTIKVLSLILRTPVESRVFQRDYLSLGVIVGSLTLNHFDSAVTPFKYFPKTLRENIT